MTLDSVSDSTNQLDSQSSGRTLHVLSQISPELIVASTSPSQSSISPPLPNSTNPTATTTITTTDTTHDDLSDIPITITHHRFGKLDPLELRLHTLSAHSHIISNYDDSAEMLALNSPRSDEAFFSDREPDRCSD